MADKDKPPGHKSAALRQSVGFAPKNMDQLPKEVYKSLFFSTTSGDALNHPCNKAGATIVANCRPSSLAAIFDPNKAGAKSYKRPTAPLVTRNACEYAQQFVPRPLEGATLNAALYALNKEKSAGNKHESGMPMKGETETKDQYIHYSQDKALKAIPENYKPAQSRHTDPKSVSLEKQSGMKRDYASFNRNQMGIARAEACTPKPLPRSKSDGLFVPPSSYAQEFQASNYEWPTRFAKQARAPPPMHGYTGYRPPKGNDIALEKFRIGDVLVHGINS